MWFKRTYRAVPALAALMLAAALAGPPAVAVAEESSNDAAVVVAAAQTPPVRATTSPVRQESVWQESIRLRGELGFSTVPTVLAETLPAGVTPTDENLHNFVNNWGFIGTADEAAEMRRREALIEDLTPMLDKWAAGTDYAGHFLDNDRGGVLVIQFVGRIPDDAEDELLKQIPSHNASALRNIELQEVSFSSTELTRAQHIVWDSSVGSVVAVSEDVTTNSLDITLSPDATDSDRAAIRSLLTVPATFETGDGQEEACTSRNQCNSPQRGGVGIEAGGACSAGWVVNRGSSRGVVTAGHCWYGSNSGSVVSGSAGTFGSKTSTNALASGTHADMRYLSVSDGRAWLYQNNTSKARVVTGSSLGAVGLTSCLFGRNSATPRCGTIQSTNTSHWSETAGVTVYGQSSATYTSSTGDSGGAVASGSVGSTARGVHSGTFGGVKHYSYIGYTSTYNMGTLRTG